MSNRADREMEEALSADGEKLRGLTGEDHGPWLPNTEPGLLAARFAIAEIESSRAWPDDARTAFREINQRIAEMLGGVKH